MNGVTVSFPDRTGAGQQLFRSIERPRPGYRRSDGTRRASAPAPGTGDAARVRGRPDGRPDRHRRAGRRRHGRRRHGCRRHGPRRGSAGAGRPARPARRPGRPRRPRRTGRAVGQPGAHRPAGEPVPGAERVRGEPVADPERTAPHRAAAEHDAARPTLHDPPARPARPRRARPAPARGLRHHRRHPPRHGVLALPEHRDRAARRRRQHRPGRGPVRAALHAPGRGHRRRHRGLRPGRRAELPVQRLDRAGRRRLEHADQGTGRRRRLGTHAADGFGAGHGVGAGSGRGTRQPGLRRALPARPADRRHQPGRHRGQLRVRRPGRHAAGAAAQHRLGHGVR